MEIKNFSKSYGSNAVYENFNLNIQDGKITCILGESGSGKTTLLNAIAGLTEYKGEITKRKCSYVFQTPRLVPNLTVFANLKLVCKDEDKILKMLEKIGLADKAQSYPLTLSAGQAQRVSVARAFLYDSQVILMDEPFSSLDLKIKNSVINVFFEIWNGDKRTAVFVTHDADEAARIADRLLIIDGGKIKYDKTPSAPAPRSVEQAEELRKEIICELLI